MLLRKLLQEEKNRISEEIFLELRKKKRQLRAAAEERDFVRRDSAADGENCLCQEPGRELLSYLFLVYKCVEGQKIETAQTYKSVDDPGKPAHASEQERYQIKIEKSDQTPVDRTNDRECKTKAS